MRMISIFWNTLIAAIALLFVSIAAVKFIGEPDFFSDSVVRRYCLFIISIGIGAFVAFKIFAISNEKRRFLAVIYLHLIMSWTMILTICILGPK